MNPSIERDDSVSPMSRSPMDMTPTPDSFHRPPILRASTGPPGTSSLSHELLPSNDGLATSSDGKILEEAPDYLNGGLPHENPSPQNGSAAASTSNLPKINRQPAPSLQAQVDGSTPDVMSSGRRSVQFAREDQMLEAPPEVGHVRHDSGDSIDAFGRSRSERFMSRLKSLATPAGIPGPRSPGLSDGGFPSTASSPVVTRPNRIPDTLDEEGSDADVEMSGDEGEGDGTEQQTPKATRRKRMRRRLKNLELRTTQNAPRTTQNTPKLGTELDSPGPSRFRNLVRRSTMPDATEHRGGLSEGEGRDHLTGTGRRAWSRGASWVGSPRYDTAGEELESPHTARMHRRRISGMFSAGGGVSDGDGLMSPRRPLFGADRATTFGAQRWKQVKNTFKLLGKKKTDQFDYYKSAELMAELRAVTPAVVMFASMLQRDEHGNKRIPVLLEQVKIRVIDSKPDKSDKDDDGRERHSIFTFALEYGSGPSRMTWTVERSITDIINLHARYKLSLNSNQYLQTAALRKKPKQPHFPYSAFPYLRGARGADDSDEDEKPPEMRVDDGIAEATAGEMTAAEATASDADRPATARRKRSRMGLLGRRQSSSLAEGLEGSSLNPQKAAMEAALIRRRFVERQRSLLEKYLQEMVHWLMFRADSNRLCRFLELSALGVRLAAEGTYHGKECYLHIQSSKGIDFRRVLTPSKVIARHSRKWFLVRQNYIVVVESPSNMNIYDVYLVDPRFRIEAKRNKLKALKGKSKQKGKNKEGPAPNEDEEAVDDEDVSGNHHTLKIYTSERKIKLFSRNGHLVRQFDQSVNEMLRNTPWHEHQRFDSFAPVRSGVFAQWLVDGRDYMWNLSRAISMAQDVIYIHDWWLSPELYMRRPAAISHKWRLDRLLQKKAQEGVKIFVIIYRNVEQAIPIDSEYTKSSLLHLHSNIMVQRSPNQLKKNQFFYAHHEKLCIVDHDVAFLGGIDLCFGRWDSPQHPLTDDRPTGFEPNLEVPKDSEHCQMYPGKDYSNPRVLDFFKLNEPYEEMYDRSRTPRMPWHDIAMQVVGQPARDLTRHFIQRWNYLRRERKPTRPIPFLLPPPDTNHADLEQLGLTGTCEVQILRSAGDWSLGYPKDLVEHSIMNAYVELIERSDHFVYMENQFFITSTETLGTKVYNRIGDALVQRIIKAHERGEEWQACVMIPLMPGFQNTVAQDSGSSVRLIMQFQYRSINRGPNSIFGRLREAGIEPEDYIQFYSLRQWGKLRETHLVTEQLYIHAKTLIVDDRFVLIGSANINERSMLGNRDSELAAVVRDTETIWSTMAGQPYEVGKYAHSLRMRLMREHLGLPVDEITENERAAEAETDAMYESEMDHIYGIDEQDVPAAGPSSLRPAPPHPISYNHDATATEDPGFTSSSSSSSESKGKSHTEEAHNKDKHAAALEGTDTDHWKAAIEKGLDSLRDTVVVNGHEVLVNPQLNLANSGGTHASSRESVEQQSPKGNDQLPPPDFHRQTTAELGLPRQTQLPTLPITNDTDIGGPPDKINPLAADIQPAVIDKDCMVDPLLPTFWDDVWNRVAANNTKLYRRVFRCMPDSEVTTWKDYQDFDDYYNRFNESMTGGKKGEEPGAKGPNGPAGSTAAGMAVPLEVQNGSNGAELSEKSDGHQKTELHTGVPSIGVDTSLTEKAPLSKSQDAEQSTRPKITFDPEKLNTRPVTAEPPSPVLAAGEIPFPVFEDTADENTIQTQKSRDRRTTHSSEKPPSSSGGNPPPTATGSTRRRRRATTKGSRRGAVFPYEILGREEAEELCNLIQGHIVQFPYDWLESEEKGDHWLYQADLLAPKEIYD